MTVEVTDEVGGALKRRWSAIFCMMRYSHVKRSDRRSETGRHSPGRRKAIPGGCGQNFQRFRYPASRRKPGGLPSGQTPPSHATALFCTPFQSLRVWDPCSCACCNVPLLSADFGCALRYRGFSSVACVVASWRNSRLIHPGGHLHLGGTAAEARSGVPLRGTRMRRRRPTPIISPGLGSAINDTETRPHGTFWILGAGLVAALESETATFRIGQEKAERVIVIRSSVIANFFTVIRGHFPNTVLI